jgi:ATP diphosphatase
MLAGYPRIDRLEARDVLRAEIASQAGPANRVRLRDEIGDLLFAIVNLARHLEIDPEAALAGTNLKFRRRFAEIERGLKESGRTLDQATLEEMDELWKRAKATESDATTDQES